VRCDARGVDAHLHSLLRNIEALAQERDEPTALLARLDQGGNLLVGKLPRGVLLTIRHDDEDALALRFRIACLIEDANASANGVIERRQAGAAVLIAVNGLRLFHDLALADAVHAL